MSDDAGDKPFAPTQHKLLEARKRGEVPSSADLPQVAASLAVVGCLWLLFHAGLHSGTTFVSSLIELAFLSGHESRPAMALRLAADALMWAVAPLLLLAALIGTFVKRLLTGPVMASKSVKPDLKRINPVSGLQRVFSKDTWVALCKSLLGATAVVVALGAWIWHVLPQLLVPMSIQALVLLLWQQLVWLLALGLLIQAVPSVFDVFYQRYSFMRRMRMDMKDLRDEHKQLEGQPEVKSERRQRHRELLQ